MLETKSKVYELEAHVLAEPWAGQKVKLVGTLDPKTNIIAAETIEAEAESSRSSPKPNYSTIPRVELALPKENRTTEA